MFPHLVVPIAFHGVRRAQHYAVATHAVYRSESIRERLQRLHHLRVLRRRAYHGHVRVWGRLHCVQPSRQLHSRPVRANVVPAEQPRRLHLPVQYGIYYEIGRTEGRDVLDLLPVSVSVHDPALGVVVELIGQMMGGYGLVAAYPWHGQLGAAAVSRRGMRNDPAAADPQIGVDVV